MFCDRTMEPNAEVCICGSCPEHVTLCSASPCCEKCGKPLISYGDKKLCYFCLNTKSKHFDKIVSVFTYDNLVQESIRRYKINGIASYAPTYAVCMQGRFFEEYGDTDFDFMCGTPSHTDKLKKGGFDQTDELCRRLSPLIGVPYRSRLLYKTRETEKQSTLGVAARRTNLTDSIAVAEGENVEGATALLIDDVCTTRSTIIECSRALKAAGAKRVFALTLATTEKKAENENKA